MFWSNICKIFFFSLFLIVAFMPGLSTGGNHWLRVLLTTVSGTSEIPEFVALGYVEDELLARYDSKNQSLEPLKKWVVDVVGEDHWNRHLKILQEQQLMCRNILLMLMILNYHTSGIHTLQHKLGCSLNDDTTRISNAFFQLGYDGQDFISFDKETLTWTAATPLAKLVKNEWDSGIAFNIEMHGYLEKGCIEMLQKYIKYTQTHVGRKVPPEAKMTEKTESGSTNLKCRATGFYPRDIDVYFVKGDNDRIETATSSGILPNSDGTYYTEKWTEIDPQDKYNHSCHIEHEGLKSKLIVKLDQTSNVALIVGIIAAVAVILMAVITVVIWKKKQKVLEN
ncbi:major histocompatibility complex class I-related gene protein-like isoform X2 [Protopterus annectens]|uniref:major histocompatibility complex class I-related gene protein-like isoform X2 n=1 Tax=Protopterus annectens TaxID=7888 RepID=UPI001CFA80CF|nr:major histocompatibility complex class I-related gene protein-like isoform X2 [Protopterus annectens]